MNHCNDFSRNGSAVSAPRGIRTSFLENDAGLTGPTGLPGLHKHSIHTPIFPIFVSCSYFSLPVAAR